MTGRATELETLRGELERSRDGKRFALVGGEAGIGKTRLIAEFAREAHAGGAAVLLGRTSQTLAKPYLPFIEAFGHFLDHVPPGSLAGQASELAELGRLVPEAAGRLGERIGRTDSPASEQFALFKSALSLLRLASRDAPLVLVLEDLHWADETTLLMLHYLLAGRGEFRGLIVATYRTTELLPVGPLSRVLAQLAREPGFPRVELGGLTEQETLSLLTHLGGAGQHGHDPALATNLWEETNGNPLYEIELVRSLLASGALTEVGGRWVLMEEVGSTALPPNVTAAIAERVDVLGEEAAEALAIASVVGMDVDPDLIALALGRELAEMGAIWDSAQRAALVAPIDEPGLLRFASPIVRRALYEGLDTGGRTVLERRVAAVREAGLVPDPGAVGTIEHLGDHWTIRLGDREVTMKDGKGVRYLARLLASPGIEVHAADLQGGAPHPAATFPLARSTDDMSVHHSGSEDAGPVLDAPAKRAYRARVEELEAEVEEAEGFNDPERAALAREEMEFIGRELAAAVGIGGRDRKAASQAERARVNVTRAIHGALDRISEHDGRLGGRLKATVRTGTFCCYEPIVGERIAWQVQATEP